MGCALCSLNVVSPAPRQEGERKGEKERDEWDQGCHVPRLSEVHSLVPVPMAPGDARIGYSSPTYPGAIVYKMTIYVCGEPRPGPSWLYTMVGIGIEKG